MLHVISYDAWSISRVLWQHCCEMVLLPRSFWLHPNRKRTNLLWVGCFVALRNPWEFIFFIFFPAKLQKKSFDSLGVVRLHSHVWSTSELQVDVRWGNTESECSTHAFVGLWNGRWCIICWYLYSVFEIAGVKGGSFNFFSCQRQCKESDQKTQKPISVKKGLNGVHALQLIYWKLELWGSPFCYFTLSHRFHSLRTRRIIYSSSIISVHQLLVGL